MKYLFVLGSAEGTDDGFPDGDAEGLDDGSEDGRDDGEYVGCDEGSSKPSYMYTAPALATSPPLSP